MIRPFLLGGQPRSDGEVRAVRSPWDGAVVSEVVHARAEHAALALHAAERARAPLAALSADARASVLERARALLLERADALASAIVDEAGKPVTLARLEVSRAADTLTDAAWAARSLHGDVEPLDAVSAGAGRIAISRRAPIGPVLAITPFNFPLNLVLHKLAPAIAAGCPVILKPALETPTVALLAAEILLEAGLPPDALSVLPLDVPDIAPLLADARVRAVSFTGSATVGWALRASAPGKRVTLELGGNASAIVEADADLDAAVAKLIVGAFAYAGQSCISVQQIFVHRRRAADLLDAVRSRLPALAPSGDPRDARVLSGPVLRDRDAARIRAWTDEALAAGASREAGGDGAGRLIPPSVYVNVPEAAKLRAEEVFGPVVVITPYDEIDEAFAAINRSRFGLQASIFTRDIGAVLRAHAELEVGALVHDDATATRIDAQTYGGVKESGVGREGPRHAVLELTEPRLLLLRAPNLR